MSENIVMSIRNEVERTRKQCVSEGIEIDTEEQFRKIVTQELTKIYDNRVDLEIALKTKGKYGCLSIQKVQKGYFLGETEEGTKFLVLLVKNGVTPEVMIIVEMSKEEPGLIESFTEVFEFGPFCRYISRKSEMHVFEWSIDPDGRYSYLRTTEEKDLKRL